MNHFCPQPLEKLSSSSTVLTVPRSPALSRSDMKAPVWDDCCARASHADEAVNNRMLAKESRACICATRREKTRFYSGMSVYDNRRLRSEPGRECNDSITISAPMPE